jgi:ABC-type glycerol-3-phosphate transport system substrate-binding protein
LLVVTVLAALLTGCGRPAERSRDAPERPLPADPLPLRLLVIDDPPLGDVILREWQARGGSDLQVRLEPAADALRRLSSAGGLDADVVIFPSGLLGELAEPRHIRPLPESLLKSPEFAYRDIFDLLRLREIRWGEAVVAVPFGSPQLVLLARPDILRAYEESLPASWQEYQALVARLSERLQKPADGPPQGEPRPEFATVEPLGPGWAGNLLLARAAAYIYDRSRYSTAFDFSTLEPLIDRPPFVRALGELVTAGRSGPPGAIAYSPDDTVRELISGRCAMAIGWPSGGRGAPAKGPGPGEPPRMVQVAALPGSRDVFDFAADCWRSRDIERALTVPLLGVAGRLGAVTRRARNSAEAVNMLGWLAGPEHSVRIASRSTATTLFRHSHVAQAESWIDPGLAPAAARPHADLVAATQSQGRWLLAPRIPGRTRYMRALDRAVHDALSGSQSPQAALHAAADEWRKITGELGRREQRAAYLRSLGIDR